MKFKFWGRREEEEDIRKGFCGCCLESPKLNREFFIVEQHKEDCRDKGNKQTFFSLYILKRAYQGLGDYYAQWNFLNKPLVVEEIYKRQFKDLYNTPKISNLKDKGFDELQKLILKEGAGPEKIKDYKDNFLKRMMEELRKEEEDDIALAISLRELKKEVNDYVKCLLAKIY